MLTALGDGGLGSNKTLHSEMVNTRVIYNICITFVSLSCMSGHFKQGGLLLTCSKENSTGFTVVCVYECVCVTLIMTS